MNQTGAMPILFSQLIIRDEGENVTRSRLAAFSSGFGVFDIFSQNPVTFDQGRRQW
jgi:hypothetical protein